MRLWTCLAMMAVAMPATADIYKCDVGGKTVFQDKPCDGTAAGKTFHPDHGISIADGPDVELSEASEQRLQERIERQRRENEQYQEQSDKQRRLERAEDESRITHGMTKTQVRRIWGDPWESLVEYDQNANRCDTWYYGGYARSERPEVTFCDGQVTKFRAYGK